VALPALRLHRAPRRRGHHRSRRAGGVPTIVTPVFLDQYDHAYLVNQLGVGFGFASQLQKIRADDLGDTIRSVVGSSEVAARAKSVGKEIRAEDGASAMVDVVQKFWSDYVETGRLKASVSERLHRPKTSFFGWLGNTCAEGIAAVRRSGRGSCSPAALRPHQAEGVPRAPAGRIRQFTATPSQRTEWESYSGAFRSRSNPLVVHQSLECCSCVQRSAEPPAERRRVFPRRAVQICGPLVAASAD